MVALTDGLQLRSELTNNWLIFARLVARAADRPLLDWYAQQYPAQPQHLWQHVWRAADRVPTAAVDYPRTRLKNYDQTAGVLASRSAWPRDEAIITIIETGQALDDAAPVQRSLLMQAYGQPWFTTPAAPRASVCLARSDDCQHHAFASRRGERAWRSLQRPRGRV